MVTVFYIVGTHAKGPPQDIGRFTTRDAAEGHVALVKNQANWTKLEIEERREQEHGVLYVPRELWQPVDPC